MFAIVFPSGLVLIVLSGAELFTGNCMFLMPGLLSRKIALKDLAKNWGISYIGNFLGCLFVMGILVYLSGISAVEPYNSMIIETGLFTLRCFFCFSLLFADGAAFACSKYAVQPELGHSVYSRRGSKLAGWSRAVRIGGGGRCVW